MMHAEVRGVTQCDPLYAHCLFFVIGEMTGRVLECAMGRYFPVVLLIPKSVFWSTPTHFEALVRAQAQSSPIPRLYSSSH